MMKLLAVKRIPDINDRSVPENWKLIERNIFEQAKAELGQTQPQWGKLVLNYLGIEICCQTLSWLISGGLKTCTF